ncbi:MAG TPA: beta-eliminating lyase-related protein [Phenylobacterium sp.]
MSGRYDFASDNVAPAAPEALAALARFNTGFAPAYGSDAVTAQAADLVRAFLDADAQVHFVASGTAANAIALAALCRPFDAVLAHEHAHICTDETGAPGLFGHGLGLIPLPGGSGKLTPESLAGPLSQPHLAHRQSAAALSVTNATEYGTVYDSNELAAVVRPAREKGLGVHFDGARLANAVAAGFDAKSLRHYCDIAVFGGTKAGGTPAEAIVIFDPELRSRFDARLKQAGQLPSKARFYAAPFIGLLEDGALLRHAAHANTMARRLADRLPFPIRHAVEANAVFADIDEPTLARIHASGWFVHRFLDGSVRFMCSWATTPEAVDELGDAMRGLA